MLNGDRTILCFSWNTDQIPLCEAYLDNKTQNLITKSRGIFSKRSSCYNPLFFDEIEKEITKYSPRIQILVFLTEGDLESGTWFHSDFLPDKFGVGLKFPLLPGRTGEQPTLRFSLLARDKFSGQPYNNLKTVMRMSIYVPLTDKGTKVIELNKGLLFNDNNLNCNINSKIDANLQYVENAKILTLYVQSSMGKIAFVGVQYAEKTPDQGRMCIKQLEEKFINNKNLDHVFIMGDFANDYKEKLISTDAFTALENNIKANKNIESKNVQLNNLRQEYRKREFHLNEYRKNSLPETYDSANYRRDSSNESLDKQNENLKTYYQSTYEKIENGLFEVGYHDRILHKNSNNNQIVCTDYKVIKGFPIHKDPNNYHFGILGIYKIPK